MFALARIFGNIPEDLFSRSDEQAIFRAVAKAGLGPKLLVCHFARSLWRAGGIIPEVLHGCLVCCAGSLNSAHQRWRS